MNNQLEFADLLGLLSFYLNVRNLSENEQQSAQTLEILKQNNIGEANDKQAAYLLQELGRKFDEINEVLKQILEVITDGRNATRNDGNAGIQYPE